MFQSQTRRLLPRNEIQDGFYQQDTSVSIADATLASSQLAQGMKQAQPMLQFQSQTRRLLPRKSDEPPQPAKAEMFQSQTRRLLPRNQCAHTRNTRYHWFQSQTRRLLPRNGVFVRLPLLFVGGFNRRRDACFLATQRWARYPA